MKSAGIVRKVDDLGRIVMPIELRRRLDISPGDPVEILLNGTTVVISKYSQACIFCSGKEELTEFSGKLVCKKCRKEMAL
ncbi:MAG: AbrB/MazE/SpoVT family DNA-binding domain-containing protein [Clostridia bacterium]|nr:AbrB/MazE/SpoVT family DNA-binding domain-containing protein [Clostridia bacterium]